MLIVQHVAWEGAHRIAESMEGLSLTSASPLAGDPLPNPDETCGAVFMGGPMGAGETDRLPGLADEVAWLAAALDRGLPVLGVCLGAQLLARALGAEVRPAAVKELGWAPIEVLEPDDPLVGPLASETQVFHWHGDVFDLPPGAVPLARSAATAVQAFRFRDHAWGLLFHAEADARLVERWLAEPSMAAEAAEELGPDHAAFLRAGAARDERDLVERSTVGFAAFAERCRERVRS